jgi:hypothetical protein
MEVSSSAGFGRLDSAQYSWVYHSIRKRLSLRSIGHHHRILNCLYYSVDDVSLPLQLMNGRVLGYGEETLRFPETENCAICILIQPFSTVL